MARNEAYRLAQASPPLKTLFSLFVISLLVGYVVALIQVEERTHMDVAQMLILYRGDADGMIPPPSFATLLSVAHVHTLSQPVLFFVLSLLFAFSERSEKVKSILIACLFVGSLISNAAPFLIRYVSPWALILLPASQMAIMAAVFFMSFTILRDLWKKPMWRRGGSNP